MLKQNNTLSLVSEDRRAVECGVTIILKAFILDGSKKEDYQRTFFLSLRYNV